MNVTDATIEELHRRADDIASTRDNDLEFANALVDRIDRQMVTIRNLFGDVARLSMEEKTA